MLTKVLKKNWMTALIVSKTFYIKKKDLQCCLSQQKQVSYFVLMADG